MKNTIKVNGVTTVLYVKRSNGETLEVLIDTADLPNLITLNKTWGVTKNGRRDDFFVQTTYGNKTVKLQRYLTNPNADEVVIHLNGNSLDNRRANLKVVHKSLSGHYRKSVNKNNRTGVRGVVIDPKTGRYKAFVHVKNKKQSIGTFESLDEAKKAVESARDKLLGSE